MHGMRLLLSALASLVALLLPIAASAQIADRCLAVAQAPQFIWPVALGATEVRLTFVGHATWLIESPGGVTAAKDYNDYVRPPVVPDITTKNR